MMAKVLAGVFVFIISGGAVYYIAISLGTAIPELEPFPLWVQFGVVSSLLCSMAVISQVGVYVIKKIVKGE